MVIKSVWRSSWKDPTLFYPVRLLLLLCDLLLKTTEEMWLKVAQRSIGGVSLLFWGPEGSEMLFYLAFAVSLGLRQLYLSKVSCQYFHWLDRIGASAITLLSELITPYTLNSIYFLWLDSFSEPIRMVSLSHFLLFQISLENKKYPSWILWKFFVINARFLLSIRSW